VPVQLRDYKVDEFDLFMSHLCVSPVLLGLITEADILYMPGVGSKRLLATFRLESLRL
jgi:hypothetical protein